MARSSKAPPPNSKALRRCPGSSGKLWRWSAVTERSVPIVPAAINARKRIIWGRKRVHIASRITRPLASASATMARASFAFKVKAL